MKAFGSLSGVLLLVGCFFFVPCRFPYEGSWRVRHSAVASAHDFLMKENLSRRSVSRALVSASSLLRFRTLFSFLASLMFNSSAQKSKIKNRKQVVGLSSSPLWYSPPSRSPIPPVFLAFFDNPSNPRRFDIHSFTYISFRLSWKKKMGRGECAAFLKCAAFQRASSRLFETTSAHVCFLRPYSFLWSRALKFATESASIWSPYFMVLGYEREALLE